jgi:hypothetical protein
MLIMITLTIMSFWPHIFHYKLMSHLTLLHQANGLLLWLCPWDIKGLFECSFNSARERIKYTWWYMHQAIIPQPKLPLPPNKSPGDSELLLRQIQNSHFEYGPFDKYIDSTCCIADTMMQRQIQKDFLRRQNYVVHLVQWFLAFDWLGSPKILMLSEQIFIE